MPDENQPIDPAPPAPNPAPADTTPNPAPVNSPPTATPNPVPPGPTPAADPPASPVTPASPGRTVDPIAPVAPPTAATGGIQMPKPTAAAVSYGGFWIRWSALILDQIFLLIGAGIIFVPLGLIAQGSQDVAGFLTVIGYLIVIPVFLLYDVVMVTLYGATLGKMAFGLRIVDGNGNKLTFGRAILREIIGKFASGLVFYLGYLWVAFDEKKQGWHDKIAGTYVVKVR